MTGSADSRIFAPGATIGILGGGQLGRMTALAAARLGYRCHIFSPEADAPATQVTPWATVAPYDDEAALRTFAESVDLVTFEFENVPAGTAALLAALRPVRPRPGVLEICQNRLREKDFLADIQVPTTQYVEVASPEALARALRQMGGGAILKSADYGYDGKGQVRIRGESEVASAWAAMRRHAPRSNGILEAYVDFSAEISVMVARGLDGAIATYVPVENLHRDHILDQTIAPARVPRAVADRAEVLARHIAEAIDLVGIMGVEMFVTDQERVLVNELAPRPHNSGHWTMDACVTSQFEQFVRAVCGLPLGSPEHHSDAVMRNLLGSQVDGWREILSDPANRLHLYGKAEARPGRKMGHVTRLMPRY